MSLRTFASYHLKDSDPQIGASYHDTDPENPAVCLSIRDSDYKGGDLTLHLSLDQANRLGNVIAQATGDAIRDKALYPTWFPLSK